MDINDNNNELLTVDCDGPGTNAEEMTRYLVNLSKQLSMGTGLLRMRWSRLTEFDICIVSLKSGVEADAKAKFFFYTKQFIDELVERWKGPDLSGFPLSLPKKMAPLAKLITYANRNEEI